MREPSCLDLAHADFCGAMASCRGEVHAGKWTYVTLARFQAGRPSLLPQPLSLQHHIRSAIIRASADSRTKRGLTPQQGRGGGGRKSRVCARA